MDVGTRVKVSNPNQINYPLEGVIVEKEEFCEVRMSKVRFKFVEVWYDDSDLTKIEQSDSFIMDKNIKKVGSNKYV